MGLHTRLRLQVPCGIFDDPRLVAEIREHCATIRKATEEVAKLDALLNGAGAVAQHWNQLSRWVAAKDEHADNIVRTVQDYCLCQRVKPFGTKGSPFAKPADYTAALAAHHAAMAAAVKAKQSTGGCLPRAAAARTHACTCACASMPVPVFVCVCVCGRAWLWWSGRPHMGGLWVGVCGRSMQRTTARERTSPSHHHRPPVHCTPTARAAHHPGRGSGRATCTDPRHCDELDRAVTEMAKMYIPDSSL